MNFKLFLFVFLVLKSCSFPYESFDDGVATSLSFIQFNNQTEDTAFVWHEMVFGDKRREISQEQDAPPHMTSGIILLNYLNIQYQFFLLDNSLRLDTAYIYVSDKHEDYALWYNDKVTSKYNNSAYYQYRYIITKDNYMDVLGQTNTLYYGSN